MKEQQKTIDLLHILKLLVDMRNDSENQKYVNWSVSYLFSSYLFGKNISIMQHIELIFVSMLVVCRCVESLPSYEADEKDSRQEQYRLGMLSLFRSVVDVYSVIFRHLTAALSNYMSSNKRVSAETKKTFLKSVKLLAFFEASGQKQILNQGQNKRKAADEVNFKFFKILIERCPEFIQFVRFVHKTDTENALDVIEF
jgi:hypothetical protein